MQAQRCRPAPWWRPVDDASVVAGADDDSDDDSGSRGGRRGRGGGLFGTRRVPLPESSSSPHAAAINARPTATAAIRLVRLLITWILLIEFQREVVLPLERARAVQFTL